MQHYLVVSGQLHNLAPSLPTMIEQEPASNPLFLMQCEEKKSHTLPGIKPQSTAQALSLLNYSSTIIIIYE